MNHDNSKQIRIITVQYFLFYLLSLTEYLCAHTYLLWMFPLPHEFGLKNAASIQLFDYLSVFQLVRNRVGNDRYTERWMQTINEAPKVKAIQTDKINFSVRYTMQSNYDKNRTIWYETNWTMFSSFFFTQLT